MKKKILFLIASMMVFVGGVKAEELTEFNVNAVKQDNPTANSRIISKLDDENEYSIYNCDNLYTTCTIEYKDAKYENVKMNWTVPDENIKAKLDEFVEANFKERKVFVLDDLGVLYASKHTGYEEKFFQEAFQSVFDGQIFDGEVLIRGGATSGVKSSTSDTNLFISYNGVIYLELEKMVSFDDINVIYVPDDTEDTSEAFLAAAKERYKKYANEELDLIPKGIKEEVLEYMDFSEFGDESKMSDYLYGYEEGGFQYFIIMKDSSKISEPVFRVGKDDKTNVTLSSSSAEVPADVKLEVTKLAEDSEEYKNINAVLKANNAVMFDLKAYSETEEKYITKLNNGKFIVSIPVPENLQGKDLAVYYVGDNNAIETYDVVVNNNMATFETSHFSVYTLAEAMAVQTGVPSEQNPNTLDSMPKNLAVLVSSLALLSIGLFALLKNARD